MKNHLINVLPGTYIAYNYCLLAINNVKEDIAPLTFGKKAVSGNRLDNNS